MPGLTRIELTAREKKAQLDSIGDGKERRKKLVLRGGSFIYALNFAAVVQGVFSKRVVEKNVSVFLDKEKHW